MKSAKYYGKKVCNTHTANFNTVTIKHFGEARMINGTAPNIDIFITAAGAENILNIFIKDGKIEKQVLLNKAIYSNRYRIVLTATISLAFNMSYALYNGALGFMYSSLWFITLCAYYLILFIMRFASVLYEHKKKSGKTDITERFIMKFSGAMFIALSLILSGSVYYSIIHEVATKNGTIVMITIAAYTFYKVTIAVLNAIRVRKLQSDLLTTIRNISCADAAVSVLSLQRSMLVSFEGMNPSEIRLMNIFTGAAVCLFVTILGITMMIKKQKESKEWQNRKL